MSDNGTSKTRPQVVYETASMTADQVRLMNEHYAAAGVSAVLVDVSQFSGKWTLQPDGTYKYAACRRRGRRGANPGSQGER